MRGARGNRSASWLTALVVGLAGEVHAQEQLSAAYTHAEELRTGGKATATEVRAAYRSALTAFLQLPADLGRDPAWLPVGAFCAWQCEQTALAADLFIESMRAGNQDEFHGEYVLRSLLAAGRGADLLRWGRDLEDRFEAAVWTVLVTERGLWQTRAWELAGAWLSAGETELGLWVLELLVRADGGSAASLANLALAQRQLGRESDSEATYRRALGGAAGDPALWNDLGLLLKGAGRLAEAARAFAESRRLEGPVAPTGPATTNLGWLELHGVGTILADPAAALAVVLAKRPDAPLARRVYLELLVQRSRRRASAPSFPPSPPDSRAGAR